VEEEADTTTFSLTAATGSSAPRMAGARHLPVPLPVRGSRRLEPVFEDAPPEAAEAAPDDAGEVDELALLPEDPYDLEDLRAIDEKLAALIPESEWEAKSIRSLRNGSETSGVKSKTSKHSVWSNTSSSLPGEPVLREQLEEREARQALVAIDDQLSQLQDSQRQAPELTQELLQQLLMQAAAGQSAMEADQKVLTLTEAGDLKSLMHFSASGSGSALVATDDEGPLVEARRILSRLAQSSEDWDAAHMEVRCSYAQMEDSVRALEEQAEAQRAAAQRAAEEPEAPELAPALAEMSGWAAKLEELGLEAVKVAESGLQAPRAEAEAASAASSETQNEETSDGPGASGLLLPMLTAAEDNGIDEVRDDVGDSELLSDDDHPVFLPVSEEKTRGAEKALDLELPSGRWSDADLERLSRAMDAHFDRGAA
ncbi:unnamed protein product, partial [Effrenium voratum]